MDKEQVEGKTIPSKRKPIGKDKLKRKVESLQAKIKALEEELVEKNEKIQGYLNRLKHLQAEFENYRKRVVNEKELREICHQTDSY